MRSGNLTTTNRRLPNETDVMQTAIARHLPRLDVVARSQSDPALSIDAVLPGSHGLHIGSTYPRRPDRAPSDARWTCRSAVRRAPPLPCARLHTTMPYPSAVFLSHSRVELDIPIRCCDPALSLIHISEPTR